MSITHNFVSTLPAAADPDQVGSQEWNDDHVVVFGTGAGDIAEGNHTHAYGNLSGSGTTGQLSKWTGAAVLGDAALIPPASNILTLTNAAAATLALNITAAKTLTLTATDNYTLTVPATGTAALLATANVFTVPQMVDGSADAIQLRVQGHSTQTNPFFTVEDSTGAYKLNFDKNGYFRGLGTATNADVVMTLYGGKAATSAGPALNFNMLYGAAAAYPTWSLAQIYAEYPPSISGWPGELVFKTNNASGATNLTERMRIKYNGTIQFPVGTLMTGLGQLQLAITNASISTTFGNQYFLGIGNDTTFGANKYFGIGLGYIGNAPNYNYPAYIGYQEIVGTGQTKGDLVFGTRDDTTTAPSVPAVERMRITAAGLLLLKGNVTIGSGAAGVDYVLTFDGETNDGLITWMEDEDYFKFADDIFINDAENIVLGTTTGSKLGTNASQKLGLWNATPIVQPTTAITAATFVANTSGIVDDTATFDGYTIGQIAKALRNIGALA